MIHRSASRGDQPDVRSNWAKCEATRARETAKRVQAQNRWKPAGAFLPDSTAQDRLRGSVPLDVQHRFFSKAFHRSAYVIVAPGYTENHVPIFEMLLLFIPITA